MKRFWDKVDQSGGPDACWPWMASKLPSGYGRFGVGGRAGHVTTAHRVAYQLTKGEVPTGQFVLHSCDNPGCCNPCHLRAGTHQENMTEMRARGRSRVGERNINAKLTAAMVLQIRRLNAETGLRGKAMAHHFGLSPIHINAIIRREVWKHI